MHYEHHFLSMSTKISMAGLYVILPESHETELVIKQAQQAIDGGARWVQYRSKTLTAKRQKTQAQELRGLCCTQSVGFIVNDSLMLAQSVGADGVHWGVTDGSLEQPRSDYHGIIGISCANDVERAYQAQAWGADYVAFGQFGSSQNKNSPYRMTVEQLSECRPHLQIPIVVVGGIQWDWVPRLIEAGADAVAVIGGVFTGDVRENASLYAQFFTGKH